MSSLPPALLLSASAGPAPSGPFSAGVPPAVVPPAVVPSVTAPAVVPLAAMPPEAVTAAAVTPEPVTSAVWPLAVLPPLLPLPAPGLSSWGVALAANLVLIALAQRAPVLTRAGWIHAGVLGTLLWGSLGPRGWLAVVAYLAAGSLVTRLGWRRKQEAGVAEARGGRRGPANVWGAALVGCGLGLLASVSPPGWQPVLLLGFAASFSAKLADTFGSEIGKRWGRTTLLITTLRPVPPGTEGAVSLEGTAASLLGGALMAAMMLGLGLLQGWGSWLLVTGVALLATLLESLIGATLQQRLPWLSNELVNGLQTAIAAVLAVALALVSSRP